MRRPPPISDFAKYPVVGGTAVFALIVSVGSWSGTLNVSPLYETIAIRQGELWRVLTSTLPHADVLHLAFNLYWIWAFGTLVEGIYGHARTLGIFILLAIIANGSEYAILTGGIGLSGVGYGLFGLLWVLSRRDRRFADAIDQRTIGLFVAWFFLCIFLTVSGTLPIGNIAHGMGAVAGAALGWAICAKSTQRAVATTAIIALVIAVLLGVTAARPWINQSKYGGYDEGKLAYDELNAEHNEKALRWSRDAIRMQPRIATYWMYLGIACDRLNRHPEAVAAYKRAAELEPTNRDYRSAAEDAPASTTALSPSDHDAR